MTRARKRKLPFGWIIGAMTVVSAVFFGMLYYRTGTGLPKMEIGLNDTLTLEELNRSDKNSKFYDNEMRLVVGLGGEDFHGVEIKGRGNSTWGQVKNPYRIKLSGKADLLGLGKAKKWSLLANYLDSTYLRNDIALKIANMLGEKYAMNGKFLELTVDGQYLGLYYMTHAVNVGKSEVDLRDPMGIIVELDNLRRETGGVTMNNGDYLVTKDVVNDDNGERALADFVTNYSGLEWAARHNDWGNAQKNADMRSFAEYYIMSEFTTDPDAYASSFFMYKDGVEDKIHAGPAWDYDLALGNHAWWWAYNNDFYDPTNFQMVLRYADDGEYVDDETGETVSYDGDKSTTRIFANLVKMPEFRELVVEIWQERMAGREEELLTYIEARAAYIREAALRDEARWKKTGFDSEVEYLLNWVERRYEFLDGVFAPGVDWSNRDKIIYPEKSGEARPGVPTMEVEDAENDANGARNKVPVTEVNDYSKNNPA